jgi:hypothetical protein
LSLMPNEVLTWWPLITFLVSWFLLIFRYGNKSRLWLPIYTHFLCNKSLKSILAFASIHHHHHQ